MQLVDAKARERQSLRESEVLPNATIRDSAQQICGFILKSAANSEAD
jgi:hypothetical protein